MLTRTYGLKMLANGLVVLVRAQSSPAADSMPKVSVRVYNYAHVPRGTLARAEKGGSTIFEQAGVEIGWLNCPVSSAKVSPYSACSQGLAPTQVVLRVYPPFKAVSFSFRETTTGFALLPAAFGNASYAGVFYDRVEELAKYDIASASEILAHSVAHEIGHLLLGTPDHSSTGIMRAQWGPEELQRAATVGFHFTPEQAERIRADLDARRRQDAPLPLVSASSNMTFDGVTPPF